MAQLDPRLSIGESLSTLRHPPAVNLNELRKSTTDIQGKVREITRVLKSVVDIVRGNGEQFAPVADSIIRRVEAVQAYIEQWLDSSAYFMAAAGVSSNLMKMSTASETLKEVCFRIHMSKNTFTRTKKTISKSKNKRNQVFSCLSELEASCNFLGTLTSFEQTKLLSRQLRRLAVASGFPPDLVSIESDDVMMSYIQGENFYNGHRGTPKNLTLAYTNYKKAAEGGYTHAKYRIGMMLLNGEGVAKNVQEGETWLSESASEGNAEAMTILGRCYERGLFGTSSDTPNANNILKAVDLYWKAAHECEYPDAQVDLGFLFERKLVTKLDENGRFKFNTPEEIAAMPELDSDDLVTEAQALYKRAATAGNARACNLLGLLHFNGSGPIDINDLEAIKWFRKGAVGGNANAMNNLGICYESGRGAMKDLSLAEKYYSESYLAGNFNGLNNLGYLRMLRKDWPGAYEAFQRASEEGVIDAIYNLANLYHQMWTERAEDKGEETLSTIEFEEQLMSSQNRAFDLYQKAADLGHVKAQLKVANYLYDGIMIEQSVNGAIDYYRKSAEGGNAEAMNNLAIILEEGKSEDVGVDFVEAQRWYESAARLGHSWAKYNLASLYLKILAMESPAERRSVLRSIANNDDDGSEFHTTTLAFDDEPSATEDASKTGTDSEEFPNQFHIKVEGNEKRLREVGRLLHEADRAGIPPSRTLLLQLERCGLLF